MVNKMNKKEILETLDEQRTNLENFVKILEDKQHCIIENNYDLLSEKMNDEEIFINKIKKIEEKRINLLMNAIESSVSTPSRDLLKLSEFAKATREFWSSEEFGVLTMVAADLKELAHKASNLNEQNRFLIDNARSFIREIISAVVHAQNKSIIDRKI